MKHRERLKAGQVVMFNGEKHDVVRVNSCAAYIRPQARKEKTVKAWDKKELAFREIHFSSQSGMISISPYSIIEIVS